MFCNPYTFVKGYGVTIWAKRTRGRRLREGVTKAIILVYIAEHGEASTPEIKSHLRLVLGPTAPPVVRIHLRQLVERGFLLVERPGKPKPNTYRLNGPASRLMWMLVGETRPKRRRRH